MEQGIALRGPEIRARLLTVDAASVGDSDLRRLIRRSVAEEAVIASASRVRRGPMRCTSWRAAELRGKLRAIAGRGPLDGHPGTARRGFRCWVWSSGRQDARRCLAPGPSGRATSA